MPLDPKVKKLIEIKGFETNPKMDMKTVRKLNSAKTEFIKNNYPLLIEKIFKQLKGVGEPDSRIIRVAQKNMHFHLEYICYLTDRRHWLAGSSLTLADITAAAHISTLDFMGDIQWRKYEGAANWYARVKSRPSFKDILLEKVPGIAPSDNYKNLDF